MVGPMQGATDQEHDRELFAIKVMRKARMSKIDERNIRFERDVLRHNCEAPSHQQGKRWRGGRM